MTPLNDWFECREGCGWVPPGHLHLGALEPHAIDLGDGRTGEVGALWEVKVVDEPMLPVDWRMRQFMRDGGWTECGPCGGWVGPGHACAAQEAHHGTISDNVGGDASVPLRVDLAKAERVVIRAASASVEVICDQMEREVLGCDPPSSSDSSNPPEGREWVACAESFIFNAGEMRPMPYHQLSQQVYREDWYGWVTSCPDCGCAYKPQPYATSPPAPDCPHGCGGRNRQAQQVQQGEAVQSTYIAEDASLVPGVQR